MSTAPTCTGCRGKYSLLVPGVSQCEVCNNLFRLGHLVWGPRYPAALRVHAARALQSCHLQLLQTADQYFAQAEAFGSPQAAGSSGGSGSGAFPYPQPVNCPDYNTAAYESGVASSVAPAALGVKTEKAVKKEKKRTKKESPAREPDPPASKEKKKHRREEEAAVDKRPLSVKREPVEEDRPRHGLVEVKGEVFDEGWSESYESESRVSRSRSRSKSPLPRRPAPVPDRSQRPASPPGPPPRSPPREGGRGRWVGPIPARGGRPGPDPGGSPGGLELSAKAKPKRTKKNKGKKKRERQQAWREERDRQR